MNDLTVPITLKRDENVGKVRTFVGKISSCRHQNDCRVHMDEKVVSKEFTNTFEYGLALRQCTKKFWFTSF